MKRPTAPKTATRARVVAVLAAAIVTMAWRSPRAQDVDIIGSWTGTSLCVDKVQFPACKDEQVIYDVRRKNSASDTATLRADKVVNGAREFMGEFDFVRAADSSWVAKFENSRVRIRIVLRVRGAHMAGAMTDEPSGRRVRDIAVERIR